MKSSLTSVRIRLRLRADTSIVEIFGAGTCFIKKTLRARLDEERRFSRRRHGAVLSLNEEQLETLQAAVEICPGATLEELRRLVADECRVTVSRVSIRRGLKMLNLPLVKRGRENDHFREHEQKEAPL